MIRDFIPKNYYGIILIALGLFLIMSVYLLTKSYYSRTEYYPVYLPSPPPDYSTRKIQKKVNNGKRVEKTVNKKRVEKRVNEKRVDEKTVDEKTSPQREEKLYKCPSCGNSDKVISDNGYPIGYHCYACSYNWQGTIVPKYYYYQKQSSELSPGERDNILKIIESKSNLEIKENTRLFLAYNGEGEVVGVTCILMIDQHDIYGAFSKMSGLNLDLDSVILYNMGVKYEHRRHGIASKLIAEAEIWAMENGKKKICLFTNKENGPAIDLYVKSGFTKDSSYYTDTNNEYKMVKVLYK